MQAWRDSNKPKHFEPGKIPGVGNLGVGDGGSSSKLCISEDKWKKIFSPIVWNPIYEDYKKRMMWLRRDVVPIEIFSQLIKNGCSVDEMIYDMDYVAWGYLNTGYTTINGNYISPGYYLMSFKLKGKDPKFFYGPGTASETHGNSSLTGVEVGTQDDSFTEEKNPGHVWCISWISSYGGSLDITNHGINYTTGDITSAFVTMLGKDTTQKTYSFWINYIEIDKNGNVPPGTSKTITTKYDPNTGKLTDNDKYYTFIDPSRRMTTFCYNKDTGNIEISGRHSYNYKNTIEDWRKIGWILGLPRP